MGGQKLTEPYYQDDLVTLIHGDFFTEMHRMTTDSFDHVITDPPYSYEVHKNAKSNAASSDEMDSIDFAALSKQQLASAFDQSARIARRWVISTTSFQQAYLLSEYDSEFYDFKRMGVWAKTTYAPQILGDRPASAWEAILYLHSKGSPSRWNGGGKHGNYVGNIAQPNGHPTAKPLDLYKQFVSNFTEPGETVLDPFAGSGTTLEAARMAGLKVTGIEMNERYCELIAKRLQQQEFDFGGV